MPNERSKAFNDGYLDGKLNYNKDCPYDDIPSIKEYAKGYSIGIQAYLNEDYEIQWR